MSVYGELAPMAEHRTQFAFKCKREYIATINIPNIAYPGQHLKIIIPQGSADHVIVLDTIKITFDLEIESTDKSCSVVNNVGRALVKKKALRLGSKKIEVINNSCTYDAYKDLYLSEKECKEKILQGIQPVNGLKAWLGTKK